ncbi:hypothetical protein NKH10_31470 [Mesorhizobium sp. M1340]|uniref:hypothetical protein n=1 Tax=Mesorhizobium sp. M1340 TaxID=2957087 RepID=UPI0033377471
MIFNQSEKEWEIAGWVDPGEGQFVVIFGERFIGQYRRNVQPPASGHFDCMANHENSRSVGPD